MAVTDTTPPPSRWTLRTIRATFDLFGDMTLSGVWRALEGRFGLALRSGAVQHYSPDPEYATKYDHLIKCMNEAATMPDRVALVFLDEMGSARWPEPGPDWARTAPTPPPETDRAASPNRLWRIIGALNAVTGRVDSLDAYIVGRAKVIHSISNWMRLIRTWSGCWWCRTTGRSTPTRTSCRRWGAGRGSSRSGCRPTRRGSTRSRSCGGGCGRTC
jgi:hypothetical protein